MTDISGISFSTVKMLVKLSSKSEGIVALMVPHSLPCTVSFPSLAASKERFDQTSCLETPLQPSAQKGFWLYMPSVVLTTDVSSNERKPGYMLQSGTHEGNPGNLEPVAPTQYARTVRLPMLR